MVRLDSNPAYRGVPFGPPQYNGTTLHEDNFANQAENWGSEVYATQTKDGSVLAFIRNEDAPTAWMTRSLDNTASSWRYERAFQQSFFLQFTLFFGLFHC